MLTWGAGFWLSNAGWGFSCIFYDKSMLHEMERGNCGMPDLSLLNNVLSHVFKTVIVCDGKQWLDIL
jgi:hypothetical protein